MRWHKESLCLLAPGAGRSAQESFSSRSSGCVARSGFQIARRRMRCGTPSRRICWGAAAICAPSRNCSGTPRCRRHKSTRPSIARDCLRPIAPRIRAGGKTFPAGHTFFRAVAAEAMLSSIHSPPELKMRCLFVADLHYSLPQFDWLLRTAPRYDLVVLAGDALDIGSLVDFRAQTLVVRKYLQRLAGVTRLFVCSGNHDLDSRSETGEKVARWLAEISARNLASDGSSAVAGDTLFTVCPWWDGPVVRA